MIAEFQFTLPQRRIKPCHNDELAIQCGRMGRDEMTSVLERLNSTKKTSGRDTLAITLRPAHLIGCLALIVIAGGAWGLGMRMGYVYAKEDVAYVLETSNPLAEKALPKWRAWADANVDYAPPADLGMIFDLTERLIPGTGGMTTGDVWNGYQERVRRAFFQREVKALPVAGPAPRAPDASIAPDAHLARPAASDSARKRSPDALAVRTSDEPASGY